MSAQGGASPVAVAAPPGLWPRVTARVPWTVFAAGLATAAAGAALVRFGLSGRGLIGAFVAAVLVVLAAIDIRERRLPNAIVLPSFAVVLCAQVALTPERTLELVAAAVGTALFLLVPALFKPGAMGMGDVKLGLLLGAALGKAVGGAILIALVSMWPLALYLYARHGREAGKIPVPFGPFLALGSIIVLLIG